MKTYFFLLLPILLGCKREDPVFPDLCPNCIVNVDLNGSNWPSVPRSIRLLNNTGNDSLFAVVFVEADPQTDLFRDAMSLYRLPYKTGKFVLDSMEKNKNLGISIHFRVYEVELDVPAQTYTVLFDGNSFIDIEKLDKNTGMVEFSFQLNMEGMHDDWHFITYPKLINFAGSVKGIISI